MNRSGCLLALAIPPVVFANEPLVRGNAASLAFRGGGTVEVFEPGAVLFTDRSYKVAEYPECPEWLMGKPFLKNSMGQPESWRIAAGGVLTVLIPAPHPRATTQIDALEAAGFTWIDSIAPFQLFGKSEWDQVRIYQKQVAAGDRFGFGKWVVAVGFEEAPWPQVDKPWTDNTGEKLYNGIILPDEWPPQNMEPSDRNPMPVPYLDHPPSVIPIHVGRQLLVDDFLVGETDLQRRFHYPEKHKGNPVLTAETGLDAGPRNNLPGACPKSGGLWWDPDAQLFRLWYEAGWLGTICHATSTNGIDWVRPALAVVPGTNQVLPPGLMPDSWTVVRDWWTDDPDARYKMFVRPPGGALKAARCFVSPDGIHWGEPVFSGKMGDRSTMFYNPFRKKWVFSLRSSFRGRSRHYWEGDDFMADNQWDDFSMNGQNWQAGQPVVWTGADELDPPDPYIGDTCQLYNLDAVAYESIMLGFYQIHRGPNNETCGARGVPKITELNFAYSRDGFHWHRPDRAAALQSERTARTWDRGYVQSLGNICTVVGDRLYFYYAGFAGDESRTNSGGLYANGAMGIAFLRRDGFASMDAGAEPGTLTTRPVVFSGKHLFVNVDAPQGALRAEVLDENGAPIAPFTLADCRPLSADGTIEQITWKDGSDLSRLASRPVRFRFELENGALYAFWVSRDGTGRSDGYVAGGGPGYTGPTDTVGKAALK